MGMAVGNAVMAMDCSQIVCRRRDWRMAKEREGLPALRCCVQRSGEGEKRERKGKETTSDLSVSLSLSSPIFSSLLFLSFSFYFGHVANGCWSYSLAAVSCQVMPCLALPCIPSSPVDPFLDLR